MRSASMVMAGMTSLLLVAPIVAQAPAAGGGAGGGRGGGGGGGGGATAQAVQTRLPLAERIRRVDVGPDATPRPGPHGGAGPMAYGSIFGSNHFENNLWFLHRGWIAPGGGIGSHFHNNVEEMFVIFDGAAEFTIDGRTAVLEGPAGAPVVAGHWHAIRNHTDRPVQWMNINISGLKGVYDAFDLGDPRVGVVIDPIPPFMTMRLDRSRMGNQPQAGHGAAGPVQVRRALAPTVFRSMWSYVDHMLLPPGATLGGHLHPDVEEFYYVMAGTGTIRVGGESSAIRNGDAIPIHMSEIHAVQNSSTEPLELMVVGIARDQASKDRLIRSAAGASISVPGY